METVYDAEGKSHLTRPVHSGEQPEHRVLREIFRHYTEFREYVGQGNDSFLEHTYLAPDRGEPQICPEQPRAHGEHEALDMRCILCEAKLHRVTVSFDFWDLQRGIKELAPRKREALFYNVIRDMKQKDVAKKMHITTVTVGQYVEHAFRQLIERHAVRFVEHEETMS